MKILAARNPAYTEQGDISLEVLFEEFNGEWIPFCASKNDCEAHGVELFNRAAAGEYGEVTPFVLDIETVRDRKMESLRAAFAQASKGAHVSSSLGYEIDADDTANRNVTSLVRQLTDAPEGTSVQFRDYNNEYHTVTLSDLVVMQKEIDANGSRLYGIKWTYEQQIQSAETIDALDAITINFV